MATRPYFMTIQGDDTKFFEEKKCDFEFVKGMNIKQKQKCISSFHKSILNIEKDARILEVSNKSENRLGKELSAFNLQMYDKVLKKDIPVENVFQSSKVFEGGNGPFPDLLERTPVEAKQYFSEHKMGNLVHFDFHGEIFAKDPQTFFYDYIYINALYKNIDKLKCLLDYTIFTDIEFNPKKSINCQARSVAIFVSLYKRNIIEEYINDKNKFQEIYPPRYEQGSILGK